MAVLFILTVCLTPLAWPGTAGAVSAFPQDPLTGMLQRYYPQADSITQRTEFLTEGELAEARVLAGTDVPIASALVTCWEVWQSGRRVERLFLDTHRVRTDAQSLLFALSPTGTIDRLEVLRFDEPPDYRAPTAWSAQLLGHALDEGLRIGADIRGITGASLTARATVRAARRVLALDAVIRKMDGGGR